MLETAMSAESVGNRTKSIPQKDENRTSAVFGIAWYINATQIGSLL